MQIAIMQIAVYRARAISLRVRPRIRAVSRAVWHPVWGPVLSVWLASRAAYGLVSLLVTGSLHAAIMRWWFWDAAFLLTVARDGYTHFSAAAYFPLYPLLVHLGTAATLPQSPTLLETLLIGLLIANAASLGFVAGLVALALDLGYSPRVAIWIVVLVSCYPLAFFLASAYSDPLLLAFAVWALILARREHWFAAAACAFLAGLSHPAAIALVAPLAILAWRRRSFLNHEIVLAVIGVPLAWLTYALYCLLHFSDPLAMLHAQQVGDARVLAAPWTGLLLMAQQVLVAPLASPQQIRLLADALPLLAVASLLVMAIVKRSLPEPEIALVAGVLLLTLISPVIHANSPDAYPAAGRHMLAAFPLVLLIVPACVRRPWVGVSLALCLAALQLVALIYELSHGWLV